MTTLEISTTYCQRDSAWASIILGNNQPNSGYTIGGYGCLITVISDYLTAIHHDFNPLTLNNFLIQHQGFVNGGYYDWSCITRVFTDISLVFESDRWVSVPVPEAALSDIRSRIDQGFFVICEIDANPSVVGEQMHFVGCYGYTDNDFLICDPWDGKQKNLSSYGVISQCLIGYRCYSVQLPTKPLVSAPETPSDDLQNAIKVMQSAFLVLKDQEGNYFGNLEGMERELVGAYPRYIDIVNLNLEPIKQPQPPIANPVSTPVDTPPENSQSRPQPPTSANSQPVDTGNSSTEGIISRLIRSFWSLIRKVVGFT